MSDVPVFDLREQVARIDRLLEESGKLSAERLKLDAERLKLESERLKLEAERIKYASESVKLDRDRFLAPFALTIAAMGAGAALLAAAIALVRLHG